MKHLAWSIKELVGRLFGGSRQKEPVPVPVRVRNFAIVCAAFFGCVNAVAQSSIYVSEDSLTTNVYKDNAVPYVILRSASGTFSAENRIPMVLSDTGYVAKNVEITNGGLVFYNPVENADTLAYEYTSLATWGDHPALEGLFNPLLSTQYGSLTQDYIEVPDGTYDIYFFDRSTTFQSYQLFSFNNVHSGTNSKDYPPQLYIINPMNEVVATLSQSEYPGLYSTKRIPVPDDGFKLSYQKSGYYIPAFLYGSASATKASMITADNKMSIRFGDNTHNPFGYASAAMSPSTPADQLITPGDTANIIVDLTSTPPYMMFDKNLNLTGCNDIVVDGSDVITAYYSIDGCRLPHEPRTGLYIAVNRDGVARKIMR